MTRLKEIEARKLEIREEVESTEEVEKIEELNYINGITNKKYYKSGLSDGIRIINETLNIRNEEEWKMNKKDFTKTSTIKNYIYIEGINHKFIVKKHQFSSIFKPKVIHDFDEIKSIDLLQDGDFYCGKSSLLCRILFGAIGDFISRKNCRHLFHI